MKATGIVRRIDDLGRVVVPKEIRRTLRIREGDPLEIYTSADGSITLKKYSPIFELSGYAEQLARVLENTYSGTALVSDKDNIIAACGELRKNYERKAISKKAEQAIENRKTLLLGGAECIPVYEEDAAAYSGQVIRPIICEGQAIGGVFLLYQGSHRRAKWKCAAQRLSPGFWARRWSNRRKYAKN